MIVPCAVEPPKHMYVFACQSTVLNPLKWRRGRPCYWHVPSLFADGVGAHLPVSAVAYSCTAAPAVRWGDKGLGLEWEFLLGSAVPVFWEIREVLWDSQSFLDCSLCSLRFWEAFYSVEILVLLVLRVKCNDFASILLKGFLASWELWTRREMHKSSHPWKRPLVIQA